MLALLAICLLAFSRCSDGVVYGGLCDSSNTCSDANTFCWKQSACTKGLCVCNSGYAYRSGSAGCVAEVLLGDTCSTYCTVGTCTGGTCKCSTGLTASSDKRHCVGKSLGQSCSTTYDCQGTYAASLSGTVTCSGGTCKCATGYKTYDSDVCVWYGNDEACTVGTTQCAPSFSSCTNNKCTCQTVSGTQYVWRTVYMGDGRSAPGCVHPSAQEVGYGQTCTEGVQSATTRYCGKDLYCGLCPGDSGTLSNYKCLSGAAQLHVSLLLLAIVGVIAALLNA